MIDHVGYTVTNYETSKKFYLKALACLGYTEVMNFGTTGGFGKKGEKGMVWFGEKDDKHPVINTDIHIAFIADNHEQVDEFYKAGLEAGGKDNGAPGIRTQYSPTYYGAFLLDPDGNNVEVVCK